MNNVVNLFSAPVESLAMEVMRVFDDVTMAEVTSSSVVRDDGTIDYVFDVLVDCGEYDEGTTGMVVVSRHPNGAITATVRDEVDQKFGPASLQDALDAFHFHHCSDHSTLIFMG